jgi:hypothetical protein
MEGEAIDAEADRNRGNEWVEGDGEFRVCEKGNGLDDVTEDDEVSENVDRKGIECGKTNDEAKGREINDVEGRNWFDGIKIPEYAKSPERENNRELCNESETVATEDKVNTFECPSRDEAPKVDECRYERDCGN